MPLFTRWKVARLRRRADQHRAAAVEMLRTGQIARASHHNSQALHAVLELIDLEPDDREHTVQSAGLYYNMAAIHEQAGDLDLAVDGARGSLTMYQLAIGGDVAAENLPLMQVLEMRGRLFPAAGGPDPREVVPLIADAKARLARLLAKTSGASAAAEVRTLGTEAVATYQQLARFDRGFAEGLARVQRQYAQAQRHLDGAG